MLDSNRVARRKEAVRKSFEELDRDGDGFITAEDLVKVRACQHVSMRACVHVCARAHARCAHVLKGWGWHGGICLLLVHAAYARARLARMEPVCVVACRGLRCRVVACEPTLKRRGGGGAHLQVRLPRVRAWACGAAAACWGGLGGWQHTTTAGGAISCRPGQARHGGVSPAQPAAARAVRALPLGHSQGQARLPAASLWLRLRLVHVACVIAVTNGITITTITTVVITVVITQP